MIGSIALSIAAFAFVAACIGMCCKPQRIADFQIKFSLRTLAILTLVAPPLLAGAWWNQESLLSIFDSPPSSTTQSVAPRSYPSRPAPRTRINQRVAASQRFSSLAAAEPTADDQSLHFVAGACTATFFPLAVVLMVGVFVTSRDWRRPPKVTPLLITAMIASLLAAVACAVFFLSVPMPPDHLNPMAREIQQQPMTWNRP